MEAKRRRFNQARIAHVANDDEASDSIEEASGGFARFIGPDRTEAVAHHNMSSLIDAAFEVERTPSPEREAPSLQVIPNESALSLMFLADLSSQQPRTDSADHPMLPEPQQAVTPKIKQEYIKRASPVFAPQDLPLIPSQAAHSSPVKASQPPVYITQDTPRSEPNGISDTREVEAPPKVAPARTTHRIMDILNNDEEVPVSRVRESLPPIQEPSTSSRREAPIQHNTPSHSSALRLEPIIDRHEPPVDQALMDALGEPQRAPSIPPSPRTTITHGWSIPGVAPVTESEDALRRRDPLRKLRELLDRKSRDSGRDPSDRSQPDYYKRPEYPSFLNSPPGNQTRPEIAGYDPDRPSAGLYSASSSAAPLPSTSARRASQDQGSASYWERDRRMSGSQASQQPTASPYQANASAPYQGEHHTSGLTPPIHQSPYAPPPGSLPLPPKPPGPPPSAPINFRFAHYDPVPPRQSYPGPSLSYPRPTPPTLGPPPPQYSPGYSSAPLYPAGGYVPPPESFQAPPPPPTSLPTYPPLKIHQYGGQPILPANMAPPPQTSPHMTFVGQAPPPQAYSPPQGQPPVPHYEQRDAQGDRPSGPQSRPRRQYRSYHAPGTQFRSYQGPGESRRRGG